MSEKLGQRITAEIIRTINKTGPYASMEKVKPVLRANKKKLAQRYLTEYLPTDRRLRGLDIGAGDGEFAAVTKELNPNISYFSSEAFIQNGNQLSEPFVQAKAEFLPFLDQSFDFITVHFAFHHFRDKFASFMETVRVLKSGGLLFIKEEFPRFPGQEYFLKINDQVSNETISGAKFAAAFVENINYFSRSEIANLIALAQLKVLEDSGSKPVRWIEWFYKSHKRLFVLQKQ
ncbi:MAG: methyltransferase domain-containing protein [Candidatus Pacebacteria bacterium]|nr:methyltransferase domain-containing protein [Candidatus Paceibacterota bacterium]